MRRILLAIAAFALHASASAAPAKPAGLLAQPFTCPLTGTAFTQDVGYSTFPLVTFPDGSYPGDEQVNTQVPVCPDDGLVLLPDFSTPEEDSGGGLTYRTYSQAELVKLPALIADPAYAALKADGRYAQAYWIATQLGRPTHERFYMLQRATWGTADAALRRKLVAQFVAEAPALIDASGKSIPEKQVLRVYIVNGLRELGRFDEALALVQQVFAPSPSVAEAVDPDEMFEAESIAASMLNAIEEKDMDRFPVGLMPRKWANVVCNGKDMRAPYTRTETTKAACARRKAEEAREIKESNTAFTETTRLHENPQERDRLCAATPEDKRSKGLAMACEMVERERDERAASEMVKDGEKVATLCEATREDALKGANFYACNSYGVVFESALGRLIADDDAAFAILCPEGDRESMDIRGRYHRVSSACGSAQTKRRDRKVEAVLSDRAKSDALCTATPENKWTGDAIDICYAWQSRRRTETIERLATDANAFAQECGRFAKTNSAGNEAHLEGPQENCNRAYRQRENTRAREEAEPKGLRCFHDAIYSPDRPRCVPVAQYEAEMRPATSPSDPFDKDFSVLDESSSLSQAARIRAADLIAQAKRDKTYPKKRPGDRY